MRNAIDELLTHAHAELEWRVTSGAAAAVETLAERFPALWKDDEAALELIYAEYVLRHQLGDSPTLAEYCGRFPQHSQRLPRLAGLYELLVDADSPPISDDAWSHFPKAFANAAPAEYAIIGELGRGSMAVVLRARHQALGREVALKIMKAGPWLSAEDDARIRREARTAAKLDHPNIVTIHDVGQWNDAPFLAFELVEGGTLAEALAERPVFQPEEIATFIATLARAMHYAHQQGVIHRDLKPANILLVDGTLAWPKIADFGLSFGIGGLESQAGIIGTPGYMSPEQAVGDPTAAAPAADVHALGVILHEMLAGAPPFVGATVYDTLELVKKSPPPSLPSAPPTLSAIVAKCLAKDPAQRYARAADLAEDLERFTAGRPILATPCGQWMRLRLWARRNPAWATLSALCVVILTTAAVAVAQQLDARAAAMLSRQAEDALAAAETAWRECRITEGRTALDQCPTAHRGPAWQALHAQLHAEQQCWRGPRFAGLRLVVAPDGRTLAWTAFPTAKQPGELIVFDLAAGSIRDASPVPHRRHHLSFNDDSTALGVVCSSPAPSTTIQSYPYRTTGLAEFYLHDWSKGAEAGRRNIPGHLTQCVIGTRIATCEVNEIRVRDWRDDKALFAAGNPLDLDLKTVDNGHRVVHSLRTRNPMERPTIVALAGDLVAVHSKVKLHVWSIAAGKVRSAFVVPEHIPLDLVLSPRGDLAVVRARPSVGASGGDKPWVDVWDLNTGQLLHTTKFDTAAHAVALSPQGDRLLVGVAERVEVLDARTGTVQATLRGHTAEILSLAFTADGTRVLSTAKDNTLRLWALPPR